MEEAEALYRDFASQPHKTNEVEVFAAYYVIPKGTMLVVGMPQETEERCRLCRDAATP